MNDVFKAIVDWFNADADLLESIPGGLWLQEAPPKDPAGTRPLPRPYAVFFGLGNDFTFTSGDPYIDIHGVQFSVFGNTQEATEAGRAALRSRFDAQKLTMTGGASCMMCLPAGQSLTKETDETWHATIDYEIQVNRSL